MYYHEALWRCCDFLSAFYLFLSRRGKRSQFYLHFIHYLKSLQYSYIVHSCTNLIVPIINHQYLHCHPLSLSLSLPPPPSPLTTLVPVSESTTCHSKVYVILLLKKPSKLSAGMTSGKKCAASASTLAAFLFPSDSSK